MKPSIIPISAVKAGTILIADYSFTCIRGHAELIVCEDGNGDLYVPCRAGGHSLSAQKRGPDEHDAGFAHYIGFWLKGGTAVRVLGDSAMSPSSKASEKEGEGEMTWFEIRGDGRLGRCATEGCGGQPTYRLEADGVRSFYCSGCHSKITTQPADEKAMVFKKHTPQCLELQQKFHAEEGSELVFCDCPEIAAAPRALPADDEKFAEIRKRHEEDALWIVVARGYINGRAASDVLIEFQQDRGTLLRICDGHVQQNARLAAALAEERAKVERLAKALNAALPFVKARQTTHAGSAVIEQIIRALEQSR